MNAVSGTGHVDDPWTLKTPSLTFSEFQVWRGRSGHPAGPGRCQVGATRSSPTAWATIEDFAAMLKARGDQVDLGNADESKPVKDGSVEAWARSESNPVGGYYGLRKGYRGRFANYVTPVLECPSVWPNWSTTPRTIACARRDRFLAFRPMLTLSSGAARYFSLLWSTQ